MCLNVNIICTAFLICLRLAEELSFTNSQQLIQKACAWTEKVGLFFLNVEISQEIIKVRE